MIQLKKISLLMFTVFTFLVTFISFSFDKVYAKEVNYYSYKSIHDALPKKFQKTDYVFESDGIAYIQFANNNDNIYKTSVKKSVSKQDYLYCMNYNKHILFNKSYSAKNDLFNNLLRSKIGIALYHGPSQWGELADSAFSTGNSILDYYMTQCVIHSLISKYGAGKANYGIDFTNFTFVKDADTLKKKTKLFYDFCCKADVTLSNGHFQPVAFSFKQPKNNRLNLNDDILVSEKIDCVTNKDNAPVSSFTRQIAGTLFNDSPFHIQNDSDTYNSSFQVSANIKDLDLFNPGKYTFYITENVNFKPYIAGFWNCTDKDFENKGQEVGGLIETSKNTTDKMSFELLIGKVSIRKKDSISDDIITDASFDLLQFDDTQNTYVPYSKLMYNETTQLYESGNVYINSNNKNAKFKLVESSPGANHLNDWEGVEFQMTDNEFSFHYDVENTPVRGRLDIHKTGEDATFNDNSFIYDKTINLANIVFSVYATNDIYEKDKLLYKANDKIADIKTKEDGSASLDNLPIGKYYLKESSTSKLHVLDDKIHYFEISCNKDGRYSAITYDFTNKLKRCDIKLFKFFYESNDRENKKKIPLKDAKFGLYAAEDIYNLSGTCIVKKDSLLQEGISNEEGKVVFKNLLLANYYIKELEAPKGFVIHESIIPVSESSFELSNSQQNYIANIECMNNKQMFQLEISKNGDILQNIEEKSTENGNFFSYILSEAPISAVQFSLYNENDELIESKMTDKDGMVRFSHLEIGTYYYIENSAPKEYILDSEKHYITLTADERNKSNTNENSEISLVATDNSNGTMMEPVIKSSLHNNLFTTHLHITKLGEISDINSNKLIYSTKALEGITFGVYQNFDYLLPEGNTVPANTCIGYIVTDQNGEGHFDGIIPIGQYYLKELKTSNGYLIDEELHYFNVTADNNEDCNVILNKENNTFVNYLAKASVQIYKTDANTNKPLKNVEFTLYNNDNEEIGKYKTNRKGYILVENLPYGSYYFIETKCPKGYYSTNNKYYFNLESQETITLNITNQPILKLGFNEHYKLYMMICILIICSIFIWGLYMKKGDRH